MGTLRHFRELVDKLNRHYPRIKNISNELEDLLREEW